MLLWFQQEIWSISPHNLNYPQSSPKGCLISSPFQLGRLCTLNPVFSRSKQVAHMGNMGSPMVWNSDFSLSSNPPPTSVSPDILGPITHGFLQCLECVCSLQLTDLFSCCLYCLDHPFLSFLSLRLSSQALPLSPTIAFYVRPLCTLDYKCLFSNWSLLI